MLCGKLNDRAMVDSITSAIEGLTKRVFAYRVAYIINMGIKQMPPLIEIKGLGAAVSLAKKGIADVRSATSGLSTEAAALVTAVNDVREQIKQAHSDLKFEAETLGNGGPETASDEQPRPPVTPQPEPPPVIPDTRSFDRMG